MADVFVSYAREDREDLERLLADLVDANVDAWSDASIKPGEWKPQVFREIARVRAFVICLSDTSLQKLSHGRSVIEEELARAHEFSRSRASHDFLIIPVQLHSLTADFRDHRIWSYQVFNLFPSKTRSRTIQLIAESVKNQELTRFLKRTATIKNKYFGVGGELQDRSEALEELRCTLERFSDDAIIVHAVACCFEEIGDFMAKRDRYMTRELSDCYVEAFNAYTAATVLNPLYAMAWANRAVLQNKLGEHREAIASAERAINLTGVPHGSPFNTIAIALKRLNSPLNEVLSVYGRAIDARSDYHGGYENRGKSYLLFGDPVKALVDLTAAIALGAKDSGDALILRSIALKLLGSDGDEDLEAWPADDKFRGGLFRRALLFEDMEHWENALEDYTRCLEIRETTDAFYNRAIVNSRLDKREAAISDMEAVLRLDPSDQGAAEALIILRSGISLAATDWGAGFGRTIE